MGEVIELRRKAAAKSETAAALAEMMEQEHSGELEGSIHIIATKEGTDLRILGLCADQLQLGVQALARSLNYAIDKLVDEEGGPMRTSWAPPKRRLPRRLREATNLGDLE